MALFETYDDKIGTSLRLRWWLRGWRHRWRFGVVFCRECHHRWRSHYAHGYRCNHPLDPEEWDVDYGCAGCDRRERDCQFMSERDQ